MNDILKKRLIGAVVLVSLAVIFIPMLLDGRDGADSSLSSGAIPPKPDYQFRTIDIPLQVPPQPPQTEVNLVESPAEVQREETRREAAVPGPAAVAKQTPAVTKETLANSVSAAPGPKAWVVQVGSFSNSKNAFALRDKLRKGGFPTFVEQVKGAGQVIYRVRVGPEPTREGAEALQKRVASLAGGRGLIMQHP